MYNWRIGLSWFLIKSFQRRILINFKIEQKLLLLTFNTLTVSFKSVITLYLLHLSNMSLMHLLNKIGNKWYPWRILRCIRKFFESLPFKVRYRLVMNLRHLTRIPILLSFVKNIINWNRIINYFEIKKKKKKKKNWSLNFLFYKIHEIETNKLIHSF